MCDVCSYLYLTQNNFYFAFQSGPMENVPSFSSRPKSSPCSRWGSNRDSHHKVGPLRTTATSWWQHGNFHPLYRRQIRLAASKANSWHLLATIGLMLVTWLSWLNLWSLAIPGSCWLNLGVHRTVLTVEAPVPQH